MRGNSFFKKNTDLFNLKTVFTQTYRTQFKGESPDILV